MVRLVVLAGLAAVLVACGTRRIAILRKSALTYAQYHSLEKGMKADAILRSFGKPVDTLESDGRIRGLTYNCENGAGRIQQLRMVFDEKSRLDRWALRGEAVGADKETRKEEPPEPDDD